MGFLIVEFRISISDRFFIVPEFYPVTHTALITSDLVDVVGMWRNPSPSPIVGGCLRRQGCLLVAPCPLESYRYGQAVTWVDSNFPGLAQHHHRPTLHFRALHFSQ